MLKLALGSLAAAAMLVPAAASAGIDVGVNIDLFSPGGYYYAPPPPRYYYAPPPPRVVYYRPAPVRYVEYDTYVYRDHHYRYDRYDHYDRRDYHRDHDRGHRRWHDDD